MSPRPVAPSSTSATTPAPLPPDATIRTIDASAAAADFDSLMASLPVSLSPAMIFAMLQRRMSSLDGQISARVSEMEDQQAQLQTLQGHGQILAAVQAASNSEGNIFADQRITIGDETLTAGEWLERAGVQVNEEPNDAAPGEPGYGRGVWFQGTNLTAAAKSVDAEIKKLNQGAELRMMDIQSLMQQRSSEISLATNMLKSVQDGTDAIVRNIG